MEPATDHVALGVLHHQLRARERQATLTRAASSISHALATPLSVISGRVAMLGAAGAEGPGLERNIGIIQEQLRLITELLQQVVAFATVAPSAAEPLDLVEVAREAVSLMEPVAAQQQTRVGCTASGSLSGAADRTALLHLLTTIISVGILWGGAGSTINLGLESRDTEPPPRERGRVRPGPYARFSVRCPGPHLPDSALADPYQPWFGQRNDGDDTSLPLAFAVVWGIAREQGGWADTEMDSASEAVFSAYLPVHAQ